MTRSPPLMLPPPSPPTRHKSVWSLAAAALDKKEEGTPDPRAAAATVRPHSSQGAARVDTERSGAERSSGERSVVRGLIGSRGGLLVGGQASPVVAPRPFTAGPVTSASTPTPTPTPTMTTIAMLHASSSSAFRDTSKKRGERSNKLPADPLRSRWQSSPYSQRERPGGANRWRGARDAPATVMTTSVSVDRRGGRKRDDDSVWALRPSSVASSRGGGRRFR